MQLQKVDITIPKNLGLYTKIHAHVCVTEQTWRTWQKVLLRDTRRQIRLSLLELGGHRCRVGEPHVGIPSMTAVLCLQVKNMCTPCVEKFFGLLLASHYEKITHFDSSNLIFLTYLSLIIFVNMRQTLPSGEGFLN